MTGLDLTGLATRPAQRWGSIRLVPLARQEPIEDLRLNAQVYGDEVSIVSVGPRVSYVSYIPHAFVATWTRDGTPAAAYGTQLGSAGAPERDVTVPACVPLRLRRRMARRVDRDRLRFLPLHLALEGYLALHFGGPSVAWDEWSQRAVRQGLSPRCEEVYSGAEVRDLDDALRIFEIHPGQCGVLVYVADALAGAFVVPHPEDYRALHATLVRDLYGELIYQYGLMTLPVPDLVSPIVDAQVRSLADLRAQAALRTAEWADFHDTVMAGGLLGADDYTFEEVYRLGRFRLQRFLPSFRLHDESHLGEVIVDGSGRVAYLKTYRLSQGQVRRGHLLTRLARCDWNLGAAAAALGTDAEGLALRLQRSGFGYLLRQDVLDHYRAAARRRELT
ncbi:ARPP-2 domain-containing protein [Actinomadura scrupuli]|uniref:ARPP-2 domain-containing protein n=1 Tax=Actinomadura scrupuli TaxID=559629 RepID=UPI003D989A4F